MSIRLGLHLPVQKTFTIGRDVPGVARAAEQIGYDSLWVAERVLVPESPVVARAGQLALGSSRPVSVSPEFTRPTP